MENRTMNRSCLGGLVLVGDGRVGKGHRRMIWCKYCVCKGKNEKIESISVMGG
jgi:hypothetical protein